MEHDKRDGFVIAVYTIVALVFALLFVIVLVVKKG
jgi:hypothetical protein